MISTELTASLEEALKESRNVGIYVTEEEYYAETSVTSYPHGSAILARRRSVSAASLDGIHHRQAMQKIPGFALLFPSRGWSAKGLLAG